MAARRRVLAQSHEYGPTTLHVFLQGVFQLLRQGAGVGQDHKCIFRHIGIRRLIGGQRLQREGGLGRRFERGANIQRLSVSPSAWTRSAGLGSARSTENSQWSSCGNTSALSICTSQRVSPYGASSVRNSTVARPFAGTFTCFVSSGFPLARSVTLRTASTVPYPAIVATVRTFFVSKTRRGASTLSTVQFGRGADATA